MKRSYTALLVYLSSIFSKDPLANRCIAGCTWAATHNNHVQGTECSGREKDPGQSMVYVAAAGRNPSRPLLIQLRYLGDMVFATSRRESSKPTLLRMSNSESSTSPMTGTLGIAVASTVTTSFHRQFSLISFRRGSVALDRKSRKNPDQNNSSTIVHESSSMAPTLVCSTFPSPSYWSLHVPEFPPLTLATTEHTLFATGATPCATAALLTALTALTAVTGRGSVCILIACRLSTSGEGSATRLLATSRLCVFQH